MATNRKIIVDSSSYQHGHKLHPSRLLVGLQQENRITWLRKEAVILILINEYHKLA
jgi:hypothetical protein